MPERAVVVPASDATLLVRFGESMSEASHRSVLTLLGTLGADPPRGLLDLRPAYASLLVVYDPVRSGPEEMEEAVRRALAASAPVAARRARPVEVPVRYGGEAGPDLAGIAEEAGMTEEEAAALHARAGYKVAFLGFAPGFAYLCGLPERLAAPRLPTPRTRVPAGSVGIAGGQTGIYPIDGPGGWRLIGRTPLRLFGTDRDPMSLLHPGDRVRFRPVSEAEFERLASEET